MKMLLIAINSKYIHSNLAVYSLKAFAHENVKNIGIREYTINNRFEEVFQSIFDENPEVLFFSCYIWNIEMVKKIASQINKVLPKVEIWMGGPEVSFDSVKFMDENRYIKGIIKGEGELSFKQLSDYYISRNLELRDINGIIFRENDQIVENPLNEIIDMDSLIFPYGDLKDFENRIIYYESSRGCPFSCSYCMSSIDKSLRFKNISKVKEELQFFLDHKVKQVKFVDRTFNAKSDFALEVWKYILQHDNGITNFHFETAADLFNGQQIEILSKMRKGLVQIETGVQTTNAETLKEIRRVMDFEKVSEMTLKIKNSGNVHQHLDLIAGLPFEDYKTFVNSFNAVYVLKPDNLQLGFLKVLKGSFMYDNVKEYGIEYNDNPPYEIFSNKWIKYSEILRLKKVEEVLEIFHNSGHFNGVIEFLETKFCNPFKLYEGLGEFYFKHGKFEKHNRINNYNILLGFCVENDPENEAKYRELLTHEVYLREKIKTRPGFAFDQKKYDDIIKEKYKELFNAGFFLGYENFSFRQVVNMTHMEIYEHMDYKKYVLYDYLRGRTHSGKIC